LLVGDGSWRHRLETQIGALGLADRFIFTGLVPPQQVPELVGIMDVLVHLSAREGLARALPQALAAGKPVVTYDCDGAREVCFDGETGFLLRRGDLPQLCDRLLTLAQKPELRQKLSENGRKFVCRHFPVDRMVDELERLYARLWAETSRGHAG
jgi:glycosyltransferase involved in cell wall biosynthesis